MKPEKRLFIITNPTHYLNIQNYIENKESAENYIFLMIRTFNGDTKLLEIIENDPRFTLLGIIHTTHTSLINNYITLYKNLLRLKKIAQTHPYFDKIFFTNYKSWNQHFVMNQFNSGQKVLVSDGAGILLIAEDRRHSINLPLTSVPFNGHKFFVKNLLGIEPIEHLHFYSPIELNVATHDSLETFKYNSSTTAKVNKHKVYFIGSPLVEIEYLSMERNILYLKQIKEHFKDCDITYFAHRREKNENLEKYKFLGNVVRDEVPFEEMLGGEKELPGVIISYISSVLINLFPVYPQINFFYFNLEINDISGTPLFVERYAILKNYFEQISVPNFHKLHIEIPVR